jgi:hypothetical protein
MARYSYYNLRTGNIEYYTDSFDISKYRRINGVLTNKLKRKSKQQTNMKSECSKFDFGLPMFYDPNLYTHVDFSGLSFNIPNSGGNINPFAEYINKQFKQINMKSGIKQVIEERNEHFTKHCRSVEFDAVHSPNGELVEGAIAILRNVKEKIPVGCDRKVLNKTWKERIKISASLLIAEIDRLQYIENYKAYSGAAESGAKESGGIKDTIIMNRPKITVTFKFKKTFWIHSTTIMETASANVQGLYNALPEDQRNNVESYEVKYL